MLFGFFQLVIFPDLTTLTAYGWDPHQRRIVSTLLDPNFAGFIFVIIFSISTASLLFFKKQNPKIFIIGALKSPKMLFLTTGFLLLSFFTIPQVKNRVIGALTLDDTSQARIISWKNAAKVLNNQPIFGVGFNNYRYAQEKYQLYKDPNQV